MPKTVLPVLCFLLVLSSSRAWAIPAFARTTGMGCPACHNAWPRLNDFGELYRDRGYRTAPSEDPLWRQLITSVPTSFRVNAGYQYNTTTHQPTDSGDTTLHSGAFVFPGGDLYFAGALANRVSAYVDIAGFGKDGRASLQSAWGRINDLVTNWVNVKVGHLELDTPVSSHRNLTLISPFLIYAYHPVGSTNGFNLSDNALGVEVMGHSPGPGFRYSVTVGSNGDAGGANLLSAPTLYAHTTYTKLLRSDIVSRIRVGAFGNIGWLPTQFLTLTPPGGLPVPVLGTGSVARQHSHAGSDLQLALGPLSTPLTLSVVWMYGQEDTALVSNATQSARFHGGFVQLDYTPYLPLTFGGRYDGVYNIQQGDLTLPANSNQQQAMTLFIRYAVWMAPWGSLVLHGEVGSTVTENAAIVPTNPVRSTFAFAGLDFLL